MRYFYLPVSVSCFELLSHMLLDTTPPDPEYSGGIGVTRSDKQS
ncbi:hypothetical protein [Aestuariivivens sediminicola]|nr:hypothetical protein [Aestuariivivens sediminicola]